MGLSDPIFEKLILEHKPGIIVEIGSWKGASAIGMAKIIQREGLDCEIVCIDTWLGNWQHWSRKDGIGSIKDLNLDNDYPTLYYQFLSNVIFTDTQNIITPLPLPSFAGVKLMEHYDIKPDIIYVDGDHEYIPVSQDIACWYERLAIGGVFFGDDYKWPGVQKAVKEFSEARKLKYTTHKKMWVFESRKGTFVLNQERHRVDLELTAKRPPW
mgnify:CR=1 FL=1